MSRSTEESIDRVRALCLALPKVVESGGVATDVGRYSGTRVIGLKVSGRIVARIFVLDPGGHERVVLWIRTDPAEREALLSGGRGFIPLRQFGPREIGVILGPSTDWTEVEELVTDSYLIMAPKKLASEVEAAVRQRLDTDPDQ
jgi:hypothetical protein